MLHRSPSERRGPENWSWSFSGVDRATVGRKSIGTLSVFYGQSRVRQTILEAAPDIAAREERLALARAQKRVGVDRPRITDQKRLAHRIREQNGGEIERTGVTSNGGNASASCVLRVSEIRRHRPVKKRRHYCRSNWNKAEELIVFVPRLMPTYAVLHLPCGYKDGLCRPTSVHRTICVGMRFISRYFSAFGKGRRSEFLPIRVNF